MKYMVLIYGDEKSWWGLSHTEQDRIFAECGAYGEELQKEGCYVAGDALERGGLARTIRPKGAKKMVTDGPFAETREVLAGYYIIEARSIDEALAIGRRFPGLNYGISIEVRPVMDRDQRAAVSKASRKTS